MTLAFRNGQGPFSKSTRKLLCVCALLCPQSLTPLTIHNPHTSTRSGRDRGRRGGASSHLLQEQEQHPQAKESSPTHNIHTTSKRQWAEPGNKDQPRDQGKKQV